MMFNTLHAPIGFTIYTTLFCFPNSLNFTIFETNSRHICIYLNAFPIVIPNIHEVTKFQDSEMCKHFCDAWRGFFKKTIPVKFKYVRGNHTYHVKKKCFYTYAEGAVYKRKT